MNIFYSNDFTGVWPVGTAAVVVASDIEEAIGLMRAECVRRSLPAFDGTFIEVNTATPVAIILREGDY